MSFNKLASKNYTSNTSIFNKTLELLSSKILHSKDYQGAHYGYSQSEALKIFQNSNWNTNSMSLYIYLNTQSFAFTNKLKRTIDKENFFHDLNTLAKNPNQINALRAKKQSVIKLILKSDPQVCTNQKLTHHKESQSISSTLKAPKDSAISFVNYISILEFLYELKNVTNNGNTDNFTAYFDYFFDKIIKTKLDSTNPEKQYTTFNFKVYNGLKTSSLFFNKSKNVIDSEIFTSKDVSKHTQNCYGYQDYNDNNCSHVLYCMNSISSININLKANDYQNQFKFGTRICNSINSLGLTEQTNSVVNNLNKKYSSTELNDEIFGDIPTKQVSSINSNDYENEQHTQEEQETVDVNDIPF